MLALLIAADVAMRAVPVWTTVFPSRDEVRLLGADSYYHLRHARYALAHFPEINRWDHATNYPHGELAINAGLFDLAIATAALPWPEQLERVAALTPLALCVVAFVALYALGTSLGGDAGLLACALLLLYPGDYLPRSLLGFADHHVAEVSLALLALLGVFRCIERAGPWWRPAVVYASPLAIFQLTWIGAPIWIVIVALGLFFVAVVRLAAGADVRLLAAAICRYALGLLVLLLPVALLAPGLVMETSVFRLALAGIALWATGGLVLLALAGAAARGSLPSAPAAAVLFAVAAISVATAVQTPAGELRARQLLGKKSFLVAEHQEVTVGLLVALHGFLPLLALLGLVLAVSRLRQRGSEASLFTAFAAALAIVLWISTADYAYTAGPLLALLAAFALSDLTPHVPPRQRVLAGIAAGFLILLPLWPLRWTRPPWPQARMIESMSLFDDGWAEAMRWLAEHTPPPTLPVGARVPAWSGGDFAYPPGTYGVWAAWDFGSIVAAMGRRPVAWSQGISGDLARWLLESDEDASLARLDRGCRGSEEVRFVVLDASTLGDHFVAYVLMAGRTMEDLLIRVGSARVDGRDVQLHSFGPIYGRSIAARLYHHDGAGLGRYRLVFASRQESFSSYIVQRRLRADGSSAAVRRRAVPLRSPEDRRRHESLIGAGVTAMPDQGVLYDGTMTATVKIFERVAGARVAGAAPAGATVGAHLELHVPGDGRRFKYRNETIAGPDGRYELVVPHATSADSGHAPAAIAALSSYQVRAWSHARELLAEGTARVEERQVQEGSVVRLDLVPSDES